MNDGHTALPVAHLSVNRSAKPCVHMVTLLLPPELHPVEA
jgi:hypothetical protein